MNTKINAYEPIHGFHSIPRKSNNKTNNEIYECLDIMKCIHLDKFGNDNLNFAAMLINGHHRRNITEKLYKRIQSELTSNNFKKLSSHEDIMGFIENVLVKFDQKFLNDMANLYKEKSDVSESCKFSKSDSEVSEIIMKIEKMENELRSGATVAIAALIKGNIYISNIGDNQIILVLKNGDSNDIDAHQFLLQTVEHSYHDEKEINRIKEDCCLNPDALRWLSTLSQERCHSRCIGDYEMKKQYKQFECLTDATSSPLICTPQSQKCIPFDDNYTHILLVSSGLFHMVRELIYDTDKVPGEISRKFFEIKAENHQDSLSQICKKVLEFYVAEQKQCHDRIRLIMEENFQLMEYTHHDDLSLLVVEMSVQLYDSHVIKEDSDGFEVIENISSNVPSATDSFGKDFSNSRDAYSSIKSGSNFSMSQITSYVEFDEWDLAMSKMTPSEIEKLDLITNSDDSFGTPIVEESENILASRSTTIEENKTEDLTNVSNLSPDYRGLPNNIEDQ